MLDKAFRAVDRSFHNFLAAITTFTDHTRNLVGTEELESGKRKHPGAPFITVAHRKEHHEMIKVMFETDPLSRFLKDCRNYATHHALPFTQIVHEFLPDGRKAELCLDLKKMMTAERWSARAREFLEVNQPKIRMYTLVDDYCGKASVFYNACIAAFMRHYGRELNEVEALIAAHKELVRVELAQ